MLYAAISNLAKMEVEQGVSIIELKEGDVYSGSIREFIPVVQNIKAKFFSIPEEWLYDLFIDCMNFYNDYSKKTTKQTKLLSFIKLAMTQGCQTYLGIQRNRTRDSMLSYDELTTSNSYQSDSYDPSRFEFDVGAFQEFEDIPDREERYKELPKIYGNSILKDKDDPEVWVDVGFKRPTKEDREKSISYKRMRPNVAYEELGKLWNLDPQWQN